MRRYSASFEFFVVFPFPDLRTAKQHEPVSYTRDKDLPLRKENDYRFRRFHRRIQAGAIQPNFL